MRRSRLGLGPLRWLARGALMPAAALVVHQLRFELAYGGGAGLELERQGHSYLHSVAPWLVLLIGVGVGSFLWALGRSVAGYRSPSRYGASLLGLWLVCTLSLIAIYTTQELLEGWLATGHPAGLIGVFGYGGCWAIPVAALIGLVLATIFHGARWVLDEIAERRERSVAGLRPRRRVVVVRPLDAPAPCPQPIAGGWSGRGPPPGVAVSALA